MKDLSIENLTRLGACRGGIALVKFANLQRYDLWELDIEGDVMDYVDWLESVSDDDMSDEGGASIHSCSDNTNTYYSDGVLHTSTNSSGSTWTYNTQGKAVSYVRADGYQWTRTFDTNGNLLTHVDPTCHSSTYTYNEMNDILTYTSSSGIWYSYTYSKEGLVLTYVSDIASSTYEYLTDVPGYLLVVKENGEEILTVKLKAN